MDTPRIDRSPSGGYRPQDDVSFDPSMIDKRVLEAVRHGNIREAYRLAEALDVPKPLLERYLDNQYRKLKSQVYQTEPVYAMHGTVPVPQIEQFAVHRKEMGMTVEDQKMFGHAFGKALKLKGLEEEKLAAEGEEDFDIHQVGEDLVSAADDLVNNVVESAMFNRMMHDVEANREKLKEELQRIWLLVKQHKAPVQLLVAVLSKFYASNAGVLVPHLSRRIYHNIDKSRKLMEDMPSATSPEFMVEQPKARVEQMEAQQNIQFDMMSLQRVMGVVDSALSFGKSEISMITQTEMDFARKIGLGT